MMLFFFFFSSRRRHTRYIGDWSSDVCSSDLTALAEEIACRWTVNVARAYRESGKLVEKYDVMNTGRSGGGGEYPLQDGFGWTNGVTRKLLALYPAHTDYRSVDECRRPRPAAHPDAAVDK